LAALIGAPTDDFVELVRVSGLDPKRDFRHADLSGADLRGADLTEFDLSHARLNGALLAGARLNETVHPEQMAQAVMTAPVICFFVGRACTDASKDILADLGPSFIPGEESMAAVETARMDRDRTLHLKVTRVRNQPSTPSVGLPPELVAREVAGASAGLVFCDVRNAFDAFALSELLDALHTARVPYFAFVVTGKSAGGGKTVRAELDTILSRHGRNLMVSVGGTPIASRAGLIKTLPAAQNDSVNMREMVAFLEAAALSRREGAHPRRALESGGRRQDDETPAVLIANEVRPAGSLLDAIREAWLDDHFTWERQALRGLILVDENFYRSREVAELISALPKAPMSVRVFPRSPVQDGLYVLLAHKDSDLWRLVDEA
jgi:hypothetical protein